MVSLLCYRVSSPIYSDLDATRLCHQHLSLPRYCWALSLLLKVREGKLDNGRLAMTINCLSNESTESVCIAGLNVRWNVR